MEFSGISSQKGSEEKVYGAPLYKFTTTSVIELQWQCSELFPPSGGSLMHILMDAISSSPLLISTSW